MKPRQHLPSLRQLRVFEAVARHKSIGRAATSVALSQPAVTQAIASLESRFGVSLFERGRRGSYLTDFGKLLLARSERLFDFMKQGLGQLLTSHQVPESADIETLSGKITATHIRCLIAVSENMSFDQAARAIKVSQPSLHRAARELERILRRSIYHRGPRGITTTEQGAELARQFKLAMRELDYAADEIAARQGIVTSRIAIGTLATSGSFILARAIDEFLSGARGAGVHIVEEPYEQLLDHLRAGNIDFLFSVLRRPDWATDVTETMLFDERYVIVMRPNHPLSAFADVGRDELADYDWIVPGPSTPRYLAFERLFASAKKRPTARVLTASRGLIRSLLTTSDRLTLLTRHEALLEEKLGVLRIASTKLRLPRRTYGVATRANWRPTALQQRFLDTLIRHGRGEITAREK
ncbi:MAG TPA: LysR family transcriptional regulator [Micropepsaceae bacterium]|nr:LysR family transcriptional regulator [Micropepsaceae bacterium]